MPRELQIHIQKTLIHAVPLYDLVETRPVAGSLVAGWGILFTFIAEREIVVNITGLVPG
jgi:hypothetical protein